jgi:hypothetical protein
MLLAPAVGDPFVMENERFLSQSDVEILSELSDDLLRILGIHLHRFEQLVDSVPDARPRLKHYGI